MAEGTVVALGGHALGALDPPSTPEQVLENARGVARALSPLLGSKCGLLLVHGNGPQVGIELLRGELARPRVPPLPLDVSVAQTQGSMGYILARALRDEIRSRKIDLPVACLVTSVIVEELNASRKPIGPLLRADEARRLEKERGWRVVREERGLRRVVPSPTPTSVLEIDATRSLLSTGYLVIAGGGGGIALARDSEGMLRGVDAVVDKDRTATLLAIELGRKRIVHLTSVDAIYRDHGTPAETPITRMRVDEARRLLDQGQFPEGSMGPKIEASIQFLQAGGESVLVTAADRLPDALAERAGTWILP